MSKYDGTHWVNLILYLRDELSVLLRDYTERVTRLSVSQADLDRMATYAQDKQAFILQVRRLLISQMISHGFANFTREPYGALDTSGLLVADQPS